jgi:MFS family permease
MISLIGMNMQNLGGAWLMTELDSSPIMVGLVQSAQLLPNIGFGILTGTLVDLFDRRRFLMGVMAWQIAVTLILAFLTFTHIVTPWSLIACIFAIGIGNACQAPAMSANLQEIVPREDVTSAITLNSIAMNISRAVGPTMAGMLVGLTGEGAAFLVNSASYGGYFIAVAKNVPTRSGVGPGHQSFWDSVVGGLRYTRLAKRFQAVLIRGCAFFLCASAMLALMPIVARNELGVGPQGFGILLGFIGIGAIITGLGLIGRLSARYSRDQITFAANMIVAATIMSVAWVRVYWVFALTLLIFGGAWLISLISLQVAAQMILPGWVRGRGLSLNMMSLSAGLAFGCIAWGAVAQHISLSWTYTAASCALVVTTFLTARYKISGTEPEEV